MEQNKEQQEKKDKEILETRNADTQSAGEKKEADFMYDKLYETQDFGYDRSVTEKSGVRRRSNKKNWIIASVVALVVIGVTAAYCSIAVFYQTHFFKNTSINHINCTHMEAAEIAESLDRQANEFSLEIIGRDVEGQQISLGIIQAKDMGYTYTNTLGAVNEILEKQNEWLWFTAMGGGSRSYTLLQDVTYDSEMLKDKLLELPAFQKKNMVAPTDAYISEYKDEIGGYELVPETIGNQFDVDKAISYIETAIIGDSAAESVTVNLLELGCYAEPKITTADKSLANTVNTINTWLSTEITYDWNDNKVVVDSSVIKEWATLENGQPVLDEDAIADFVNRNAGNYDTSGKYTTFTTALGYPLNLPRLSYGWKTDREGEIAELTKLIREGSKQEREPLYIRKGVWKGQNDIGNSYIEADLTHQHLYVYDKGVVVFETDFVSGDMNKPDCVSPAGIFGLTYKTLNAVLRGADYETPVTYWMPFYGNFGMHDATWRDTFGGEIYLTDQGSHGCLNLPLDAAALIYNYVYEGSPIICYYY